MAEDPTPTPTTVPGRPRTETPTNGVPVEREFVDTGEVAAPLYLAASSMDNAEAFLESLAKKLVTHGGGGDGPKHAKSIKRHNWLAVIMAALLGPGGAIAVIYATSDRSKSNSQEVEHLKEATKAIEPRMEKTEEDVRFIRVDVGKMKTSVDTMATEQTAIASGIEELKGENVKRLKDELADAKRELRRARND